MIAERFREISPNIVCNEPMSAHTTFKVGGMADMFVSVGSAEELVDLIKLANETKTPFIVIGNGSNLLVSDNGIRGLVIEIGEKMADISVCGSEICAGAGVLLSKVASVALKNSLTGLEEISGIPGTLGGGIYMNAGAYGGEIKDAVESVTYVDDNGDIHTITGDECDFGYRKSIFTGGGKYIVSAKLSLSVGNSDEIKSKMMEFKKRRTEKQPLSYPSAGSTFKRPEGYYAAALIEDAGLKGVKIGGAMVSTLHSGFVINCGGATCKDIVTLINHIKQTVREKFGVELETEVKLVGE